MHQRPFLLAAGIGLWIGISALFAPGGVSPYPRNLLLACVSFYHIPALAGAMARTFPGPGASDSVVRWVRGDALPVGGHPVPAAPDCAAVPASSRGVAAPPAMLPGCPGGSVQQTSLCGNLLPGLHRDDGGIYKASDPAPAAIHAAACFAATLHSAS